MLIIRGTFAYGKRLNFSPKLPLFLTPDTLYEIVQGTDLSKDLKSKSKIPKYAMTNNKSTPKSRKGKTQKDNAGKNRPPSDYFTTQLEQLTAIFTELSIPARREVMQCAEELVKQQREKRAALEREMAHNEWLRNFDAKMKAQGVEYEFVESDDGITPEQRLNMVAEILATIALRVMRAEDEKNLTESKMMPQLDGLLDNPDETDGEICKPQQS